MAIGKRKELQQKEKAQEKRAIEYREWVSKHNDTGKMTDEFVHFTIKPRNLIDPVLMKYLYIVVRTDKAVKLAMPSGDDIWLPLIMIKMNYHRQLVQIAGNIAKDRGLTT